MLVKALEIYWKLWIIVVLLTNTSDSLRFEDCFRATEKAPENPIPEICKLTVWNIFRVLISQYLFLSPHDLRTSTVLRHLTPTDETETHIGCVIFRRHALYSCRKVEYLLLKLKNKNEVRWILPKGRVRFNLHLNQEQLFLRKLQDKVGIRERDVKMVSEFVKNSYYQSEEGIFKNVTFFLAELLKPEINIKSRLPKFYKAFMWLTFKKAHEILRFKDLRMVLNSCNEYLKSVNVTI